MITLSSLSIGPRAMAAPKWWRPAEPPNWPELDAKILEMERMVNEFPPGRRQRAAARPEPSMRPTTKINTALIYAARAVRSALPRARDPICARTCHEREEGRQACDEIMCRATVRGRLDQVRPAPRSIHGLIR